MISILGMKVKINMRIKQQDSELQQGNKIDGEQKRGYQKRKPPKKIFGVVCLVINCI